MHYKKTPGVITGCLIIALASCNNNQPPCNRDCLTSFIDQYLEALYQEAPYGMGSGWSTWEEAISNEPIYK